MGDHDAESMASLLRRDHTSTLSSMKGMNWNLICRTLGLVGITFFLATSFSPLAYLVDRWIAVQAELVPSDAIVVLAQGVSPSGILNSESTLRTDHSIA